MTDELSLIPEYMFEWEDGTTRKTSDPDFHESDIVELIHQESELKPESIEVLAELGRRDDSCEVTLLGMGA